MASVFFFYFAHLHLPLPPGAWQLIVVYRGRSCPISRAYLAALASLAPDFADAGCEVVAVSADGRERADDFLARLAETVGRRDAFKVAYSLPPAAMAAWGLYASSPTTPRDEGVVPEPAVFLIDPDGGLYGTCVR